VGMAADAPISRQAGRRFRPHSPEPAIGRSCDAIRAGLRRFEIGKYVVFYLTEPDGVLVVRVLHQRMLPNKYI
jgi:plasmid stabilization system protein ParE